jgi:cytochrome b pre-mRNA-processing protein 3
MILGYFRPNSNARSIRDLYGMIVAQARSPAFYGAYGVPDTLPGRFDLIVLHLVMVLERLDAGSAGADRGFGQKLFDVFCRDLDGNLREMGVGDLAVPSGCEPSVKRFTAGRRPIMPHSQRRMTGSLRRR